MSIEFCNRCGNRTASLIPPDDSRPRQVCTQCGHIHYENPRLIVGCVAEYDGRILLCRRAIPPRLGFWTLPAGFMENGETCGDGARRETMEEAGADVTLDAPFALINIAHINQVHLFYRGYLARPEFSAGEESLEVGLFRESEIPWDDIAFPSSTLTLQRYFADREQGAFRFHETSLAAKAGHIDV